MPYEDSFFFVNIPSSGWIDKPSVASQCRFLRGVSCEEARQVTDLNSPVQQSGPLKSEPCFSGAQCDKHQRTVSLGVGSRVATSVVW